MARHEILRTRFVQQDGQAVQLIDAADRGFVLDEQDLTLLHGHEQEAAVQRHALDHASAPFDFERGPLICGRLLKLAADDHVLLLNQHHIISDGWSMGVFTREVAALYTAFSQGQSDPLPELAIQYADYAAWQRQCLQGERLEAQLDYWKQRLVGAPELLALPTDRPRPAQQSYAGASVAFELDTRTCAGLKALGRRHGTTLYMTLLAGWALLMARLSGQDDVVIGSPIANRQRSEVEPLIGFFANTLALRVSLSPDLDVATLLAAVKRDTLDAYAHQDLPFEQVVEAVKPQRNLAHSAIFQTLLTLNNHADEGALELPGLKLSGLTTQADDGTVKFDLSLSMAEQGDRIVGALSYAVDLFDAGTITRWLAMYGRLLAALPSDDACPVARLPLLEAAERQVLVNGFNLNPRDFGGPDLLHRRIEAQARHRPDAAALVYEGEQLSYRELNARANGLAHA
ncbi:condensation domain-containing protein, partial [Paucibacter sp. APW11]